MIATPQGSASGRSGLISNENRRSIQERGVPGTSYKQSVRELLAVSPAILLILPATGSSEFPLVELVGFDRYKIVYGGFFYRDKAAVSC